jgi:hypothetical protein
VAVSRSVASNLCAPSLGLRLPLYGPLWAHFERQDVTISIFEPLSDRVGGRSA